MRVLVALLAFALALSSVHADCSSATTTFTYTEGAHGPDNPIMVGDDDALCVSLGAICVPDEPPVVPECDDNGPFALAPGAPGGGFQFNVLHANERNVMQGLWIYNLALDPAGSPTWELDGLFSADFLVRDASTQLPAGKARLVSDTESPLRPSSSGDHVEGCLVWQWLENPNDSDYPASSDEEATICFRPQDECCSGSMKPNRFAPATENEHGFVSLWGSNGFLPGSNSFDNHTAGIDLRFKLVCDGEELLVPDEGELEPETVEVRVHLLEPDELTRISTDDFVAQWYHETQGTWKDLPLNGAGFYHNILGAGAKKQKYRVRFNGFTSATVQHSISGADPETHVDLFFHTTDATFELFTWDGNQKRDPSDWQAQVRNAANQYVDVPLLDNVFTIRLLRSAQVWTRAHHKGHYVTRKVTMSSAVEAIPFRLVRVVVRVFAQSGDEVPANQYRTQLYHKSDKKWEDVPYDEDAGCYMVAEELLPTDTKFRIKQHGLTSPVSNFKLHSHDEWEFYADFTLAHATWKLLDADGVPVPNSEWVVKFYNPTDKTYESIPESGSDAYAGDFIATTLKSRFYFRGTSLLYTTKLYQDGLVHVVESQLRRVVASLVSVSEEPLPNKVWTALYYDKANKVYVPFQASAPEAGPQSVDLLNVAHIVRGSHAQDSAFGQRTLKLHEIAGDPITVDIDEDRAY